jgi:putative ABC transport system substrate-binding protein
MIIFVIFFVHLIVLQTSSAKDNKLNITIVVSESIRPYLDAVDGFREALPGEYRVIYLKKGQKIQTELPQDLWVAVGPQAMRELWRYPKITNKIYMMVLHPGDVIDPKASPCGLPLDLPSSFQIRILHQTLPEARQIGILFDPRYNQDWVDKAQEVTRSHGISLIQLKVQSKKEIPKVLEKSWDDLDILWLIPDRTVISETIIRYLSKESLLQGVVLLGYNRFFLDSGAAMAFVIDYEKLGQKAAQLVQSFIKERFCWSTLPPARLKLNNRVLNHLGWKIPKPLPHHVELK